MSIKNDECLQKATIVLCTSELGSTLISSSTTGAPLDTVETYTTKNKEDMASSLLMKDEDKVKTEICSVAGGEQAKNIIVIANENNERDEKHCSDDKEQLNGHRAQKRKCEEVKMFTGEKTEDNTIEEKPAQMTKNNGETPPNPLSKNQLKKQKKLAKYEQRKKERRLKEREREKRKRLEAVAQGLPARTGPSRKELKNRQISSAGNRESMQVVIDLDYDDLMSERDVAKCVKQCLRIYTVNRRSACPAQLHFTGIKTDGLIHGAFKKNDGWENWYVKYNFDRTHCDAFVRAQIVYLTCESDNVLQSLEPGRVYVIGGLVDHNHQKGLCHERATKAGLQTARLPLSENVDMKTRSVLSTFHVFEILLRVAEGKSWKDAILQTIPSRKGARPKESIELSQSEQQYASNEDVEATARALNRTSEQTSTTVKS